MRFVIAAAAFFTILGRILFPAYRDLFHGIIVFLILVVMLSSASTPPSELEKTDHQRITTKSRRRTAVSIPTKGRHKRPRKHPLAPKKRKRKRKKRHM